ncbi:hypothetical protein BDM02DRAFT_723344 [Thelephora ganbajun]|uniref:Uncharacterized protein n=1 Tax=Thelephora ganbajun TaxID=370292 RepID=A0ACB6Z6N7_THEGA|nr:hypothetical protein BDM02DRAFT_723344 [Thelephora ganbajun]
MGSCQLNVLGAVFTDNYVVQPLTPLLWLGHVHTPQFFPYITSFTDRSTTDEVRFSYERCTDPDPNGNEAAFIPNTEDNQKIVIKFTEAFNKTAHCLLAARNLAPPLLSCDPSVSGDFAMVAMNYVDGK